MKSKDQMTKEERVEYWEMVISEFKESGQTKGVRTDGLHNVEQKTQEYRLSEEELNERFPNGYKEIGYDTSRRVEYTPAKLVVIEEHTYKSDTGLSDVEK